MFRATTPTHKFCFGTINPELFKEILLTYAQNDKVVLEKKKQDLVITSEEITVKLPKEETNEEITVDEETVTHYHATLKLTQEETKLFKIQNGLTITVQIRTIDNEGNVAASNKMKVSLQDVLNDEVLE